MANFIISKGCCLLSMLCLVAQMSDIAFARPIAASADPDDGDGPLKQPPTLTDLEIDLSLAKGEHSTVAAKKFSTRLLGGSLPGPTIRVKKGDTLTVNFSNDLEKQSGTNKKDNTFSYPDHANLHFHGAHISGERPGDDTTLDIGPGESYKYTINFPEYHSGGIHWIHPHRHGSGSLQVGGGAAMVLIVEDEPGDVPSEVEEAQEVIMMIQTIVADKLNKIASDSKDKVLEIETEDDVPDLFTLINGQYKPTLEIVKGEWQRWRVVHASWRQNPLNLRVFSDGDCETNLLAKDGIYIDDYPRDIDTFMVPTGGRADIMVRCDSTGTFDVEDFHGETILTLKSVSKASTEKPTSKSSSSRALSNPASDFSFPKPEYLRDLRDEDVTEGCSCRTTMEFSDQINGLKYNPDVFLHRIGQGSIVERTISGIQKHPYHQHVYPFQLTNLYDLDGDEAEYFQEGDYHDSLTILGKNVAKIKYEAQNFPGRIAVHCHRITHSDMGMITSEEVVPGGSCECSPGASASGFSKFGSTFRPTTKRPTRKPSSSSSTSRPTRSSTRRPTSLRRSII